MIRKFCLAGVILGAQMLASPVSAMTETEVRDAYLRSYGYERTLSYEDAIRALIPVADASPSEYKVNLRLGWLHYLRASHVPALAHYRKALDAIPTSIEARLGLLNPLIALERLEEATAVARQILTLDRYNYYGNLRLATLLRRQGQHDMAERVCRDLLALYPEDVSFLTELATLKAEQGQTEEATATFREIRILDPENVAAQRYLMARRPDFAPPVIPEPR
ncbi:MAG: tetratricopeptide repeat protein, partial [Alphaproteobacteria bacterium]